MFGFGFSKLVVLVVLIVAVWQILKYAARVEEMRQMLRRARGAARTPRSGARGAASIKAEDMVQCRSCDAYVAARGAKRCGRSDCPW